MILKKKTKKKNSYVDKILMADTFFVEFCKKLDKYLFDWCNFVIFGFSLESFQTIWQFEHIMYGNHCASHYLTCVCVSRT